MDKYLNPKYTMHLTNAFMMLLGFMMLYVAYISFNANFIFVFLFMEVWGFIGFISINKNYKDYNNKFLLTKDELESIENDGVKTESVDADTEQGFTLVVEDYTKDLNKEIISDNKVVEDTSVGDNKESINENKELISDNKVVDNIKKEEIVKPTAVLSEPEVARDPIEFQTKVVDVKSNNKTIVK